MGLPTGIPGLSYGPHGNQHLRRQRGLGFTGGGDAGVEWRSREELVCGRHSAGNGQHLRSVEA